MDYSRRDLSALLPWLLAAQGKYRADGIVSHAYPFDTLTGKANPNGSKAYAVLAGRTHEGMPIDLHVTELGPGQTPHPPHRHLHEEVLMVIDGTLEVTIADKTTKIGRGGVAYINSNDEHGWKNPGKTPALYFVMALGRDSA